jgi:5-methylcytosine-specific restriction endonuclease McrA
MGRRWSWRRRRQCRCSSCGSPLSDIRPGPLSAHSNPHSSLFSSSLLTSRHTHTHIHALSSPTSPRPALLAPPVWPRPALPSTLSIVIFLSECVSLSGSLSVWSLSVSCQYVSELTHLKLTFSLITSQPISACRSGSGLGGDEAAALVAKLGLKDSDLDRLDLRSVTTCCHPGMHTDFALHGVHPPTRDSCRQASVEIRKFIARGPGTTF